jgi:hypothetical protein
VNLTWDAIQKEFEFDGSWRDIYVLEATLREWQRMLDALPSAPFDVKFFDELVAECRDTLQKSSRPGRNTTFFSR